MCLGDGRPSLGTRTLHVHLLSDQVLIRKRLQGGLLEAVSLPTKVKQARFSSGSFPSSQEGRFQLESGEAWRQGRA